MHKQSALQLISSIQYSPGLSSFRGDLATNSEWLCWWFFMNLMMPLILVHSSLNSGSFPMSSSVKSNA